MPGFGAGILFGEFQRQLNDLVGVSDKSFVAIGLSAARLETAFGTMSQRMGLSATGLMESMRAASNGSISDMSLMQNGMRALDFGVAKSQDDITKLLEVAQDRGRRAGLSTERAFNDLVTGLGRLSPRILDNLNIILNTRQVYDDYAATIGKASGELTDFEKRYALSTAVMQEATPVLADQKTTWEQLKTAIANATAEAGRFAFPMIEPAMKKMAIELDTQGAREKAIRELSQAFTETAGVKVDLHWVSKLDESSLETIRQQWMNLSDAFTRGEITKPEFETGVLRLRAALAVTNPYVDDYSTSLLEAGQAEMIFQALSGNLGENLEGISSAASAAGQSAGEMGLAMAMSAAAMGDVGMVATIAAAAAGNAGVAFAILGEAMKALPSAAGAMAAIDSALSQAASAATRLAGDVGADRAVGIYEERKAAIEAYGATLVGLPVEEAAIRMAVFTAKFADQDAAMAKSATSLAAYWEMLNRVGAESGGVGTATAVMAMAAGNAGVAFTLLGAAMSSLPDVTGAMAAVQGALNQAASAAKGLAGEVGADRAIAIYDERRAAIEAYGATLVGLPVDIAAIRMAAFTQKFDDQDTAIRKATTGVSTYNKALSELESTVTGLINASLSGTKGLVDLTKPAGMAGGYDPNGPAANFGRMWDVAVNGFKSQWLAPLQQMGLIPDSVIAAGEDALKEFATRAATNFQKGTDFSLLDKGAIEAQVKEKLAAKAAMDKLVADVMADLAHQGVKGPGVKAAVQGAVGAAAGTPALGTEGETSGQSFQAGFVGGMSGIGAAIVATLGTEMKKTTTELQQAGTTTGGVWAGGFMVSVNALPGSVYATLAAMVAPDVARILGQQGQRSGKPVE